MIFKDKMGETTKRGRERAIEGERERYSESTGGC
jgi:hypothetical protein